MLFYAFCWGILYLAKTESSVCPCMQGPNYKRPGCKFASGQPTKSPLPPQLHNIVLVIVIEFRSRGNQRRILLEHLEGSCQHAVRHVGSTFAGVENAVTVEGSLARALKCGKDPRPRSSSSARQSPSSQHTRLNPSNGSSSVVLRVELPPPTQNFSGPKLSA